MLLLLEFPESCQLEYLGKLKGVGSKGGRGYGLFHPFVVGRHVGALVRDEENF